MTVYMPASLAEFTTQMLGVRCELSLDLTKWGIDVEQRVGPELWEKHVGPIPSPLRWSFWRAVARKNDIDLPSLDVQQLTYDENLLAVAVEMRLHDNSLTRLYRIHRGAALIYADLKKALDL